MLYSFTEEKVYSIKNVEKESFMLLGLFREVATGLELWAYCSKSTIWNMELIGIQVISNFLVILLSSPLNRKTTGNVFVSFSL